MPATVLKLLARLRAASTGRAVALYAALCVVGLLAAFWAMFTQFAPYDDEGTLLVTLKAFVDGDTLYRDVYSQYGPFYYEVFGGLFTLTGRAVSTDASRMLVVCMWTATSLGLGVAVRRMTGSLALGVAGMAAAFSILHVLESEPMHPHGLILLVYAGLVVVVTSAAFERRRAVAALGGALVAALLLTKVNVGIFAIAAWTVAVVVSVRPFHERRWLRWPVYGALALTPLALMRSMLGEPWAREYILVVVLATAAVLIAAGAREPPAGDGLPQRWIVAALGGFASAALAILAIILACGPSPADVYDGIVGEALRLPKVFVVPLTLPVGAIDWGIFAVAAAAICARMPWRAATPSPWPGVLRIAVGLAIWAAATRTSVFGLLPASPLAVPLALAWVAVLTPAAVSETPARRFARVLVTLLAVVESLQAYPVAGSQPAVAALWFVVVGALCLSDGIAVLRAWADARSPLDAQRAAYAVRVAAIALSAKLVYAGIVAPAIVDESSYRAQVPVPFAQASWLRLPREQAAALTGVTRLVQRYRCTTFVALPSTNSLYLWSAVKPPSPTLPGQWWTVLDDARQQRVIDQLRSSPRPCALRDDAQFKDPLPDGPLVRYVMRSFRTEARVAQVQFMLPVDP